jgi:hypothetical protein
LEEEYGTLVGDLKDLEHAALDSGCFASPGGEEGEFSIESVDWHNHFKAIVEYHLEREVTEAGWSIEEFYGQLVQDKADHVPLESEEEEKRLQATVRDVLSMVREVQSFDLWAKAMRAVALARAAESPSE